MLNILKNKKNRFAITLVVLAVACSTEALAAPEELTVHNQSSGQISIITWVNNGAAPDNYEIQWRYGDVPYWTELAAVNGFINEYGNVPGEMLTFGNNATYCFRLRALQGTKVSEWSRPECQRMDVYEPFPDLWSGPLPPDESSLALMASGVQINWEVDVSSYESRNWSVPEIDIYRRQQRSGAYEIIKRVPASISTHIDTDGAVDNCYRVATVISRSIALGPDMCLSESSVSP